MPSKSAAQARLMAAVSHGWKPDRIKGPPVKVAKEFNQADKGTSIRKPVRKAAGGALRSLGSALSGRPLPRPGAGGMGGRGGFGSSGVLGAIGSSLAAGSGLTAKRTRSGAPLSGRPATGIGGTPSNVRPRPGRGVNPVLALAATPSFEAADRLGRLAKKVGTPRTPLGAMRR